MPTLASIDGRTLTANVGPQLSQLSGILERDRIRDEEEAARKAKEEELRALIENLMSQTGQAGQAAITPPDIIDSGPERVKTLTAQVDPSQRTPDQQALGRIQTLKPDIAQELLQVIQGGDQEQLTKLKEQAQSGIALGDAILAAPDLVAKRKAVSDVGQAAVLQGQSPARTVEFLNMDENHLNLEARRLQVIGKDVDSLLSIRSLLQIAASGPEGQAVANVFLNAEKLRQEGAKPRAGFTLSPGQKKFDAEGQVIAAVQQPDEAKTTIGKARQDLKAGLITENDFKSIKNTPKKFQTDVGKGIADLQLSNEMFGVGSPQSVAIQEQIDSDKKGEKLKLSDIGGLRKEFTKLSGSFITTRDAMGKIQQADLIPSAAGDLSLIFNFMKILDPGSVVRESEFATAQNAASLGGRIGAAAQRVITGQRLTAKQRKDFLDTATRSFDTLIASQISLEGNFKRIAESVGIKPSDILVDFLGDFRTTEQSTPETTGKVLNFDAQGNLIQ